MSIAFYVGHELTRDGSTLLGGFGHEPSSHWLEIVPRQRHAVGTTVPVGGTETARMPGELIEIPQAEETFKYITSNYANDSGFPAPLTNGGLNEHGVAARDSWSPSRPELVGMTPKPQTGPNYSDLARLAMERATTAREAVEIVGRLIDEHGYTTYGGNSHLFADKNEGWVFINYAGGQGLWAAERLGSDEVRVSYPGYIQDFPVDFTVEPDYLGADHLVDFAIEQGWWDPMAGKPFNLQDVYGRSFPGAGGDWDMSDFVAWMLPGEREQELRALSPVSLDDMLALVRDPRWSNDLAGYGQVAHLRPDVHPELQTLWLAVTSAVTTPYVPIPIGTEDVPAEFKQHRYMTKGAHSHPLHPDYAALEATRYATRTFKRLMYHTSENPQVFYRRVTSELEDFERALLDERAEVERRAAELFQAGGSDRARVFLTNHVAERLLESLELGERLVDEVEKETRRRFGIRMPKGTSVEGGTIPPTSQDNMSRGVDSHPLCVVVDLDDFPRRHGAYSDEPGSCHDQSADRR
ncbi:C69 family dipeptidase [Phytoactinopolyspora endophytica]|uniref:C69 family dipeptidase n=1 Tax=Phytoactinopolyspora endophytica TaxID=1642495 RepID=UPI00101E0493|nr:C69 family dipeptidase [Phytoactinopolyspora endophytica]